MTDQPDTNNLLLLRMEIKAIRDRVVQDLDAALSKIDKALPALECVDRYKPHTAAEWKEIYKSNRRKR
jgi:hypothetical protein